jgi:DNA-binding NarL/FixJ family response regulator
MNKIYVIEDQNILRELVCRLVEGMPGYELMGDSGDGLEGLNACKRLKPDLVIVDIMVPSLNGLEIVRQLRKELPHVKLLIFSAYSSREREMLQLIAEGNTTKEIASRLNISVKTADTHRTNVMNKLDIHDIAGLTRFAIQNGLVEV